MVVLLLAGAGCASGGEPTAVERTVPPPVSDHTIDPDANAAPAVSGQVTVTFEADRPGQISTGGAQSLLTTASRRCYRLALQQDRTLEGRTLHELLVTSNGRVAGVEMVSTSADNQRLEQCVESVLGRLRFDVAPTRDPVASRVYVRMVLHRELVDVGRSPLEDSSGSED